MHDSFYYKYISFGNSIIYTSIYLGKNDYLLDFSGLSITKMDGYSSTHIMLKTFPISLYRIFIECFFAYKVVSEFVLKKRDRI